MTTPTNNSQFPGKSDPHKLWYAPDRRIRTASASATATGIVEWIRTGTGLDTAPAETALFVALHTCAFRAEQGKQRKGQHNGEVSEWTGRWRIIREYIVEKNLGLAHAMVNRFGQANLDEDDLLSEALLALTRAADRFNPWMGFRFSTYACNVITRALVRRSRQESRYRRVFPVQHDTLVDRPQRLPDFHTDLYLERLNRVLTGNLGELTDLESDIITRRFPENHKARLTLQKIGDKVGLSKERVRQVQRIALRKLREALNQDPTLQ